MADKDSDDRSLKKKLNDPEYMVSMTLTVYSQILFFLQFFITNNIRSSSYHSFTQKLFILINIVGISSRP